MREVKLTDTLVHEYTEWEWSDTCTKEDDKIEIEHIGVCAAEKADMRYFQVLIKPNDELLEDSKPRNAMTVDTWKYRARIKAHTQLAEEPDFIALHHVLIIALMARLTDATMIRGNGSDEEPNFLCIPVPGYGRMGLTIPSHLDKHYFMSVPDERKVFEVKNWDNHDILEAVYVCDRKAQSD